MINLKLAPKLHFCDKKQTNFLYPLNIARILVSTWYTYQCVPKRGDDIMSTRYYMPTKAKVLKYNIIMCFCGETCNESCNNS